MRLSSLLLALAFASGVTACGDQVTKVVAGDVTTGSDVPLSDIAPGDGVIDTAGPDAIGPDVPAGTGRLEFVQIKGDDGLSCEGTDHCKIKLSFAEERTVQVRYLENDSPVLGKNVRFEIQADPNGLGQLTSFSAPSNSDGIASVGVRSAQAVAGTFEVKVTVSDAGVAPLFFTIEVSSKIQVPLTIIGEYNGVRPEVVTYKARIYRETGSAKPTCDDIEKLFGSTSDWESADHNLFPLVQSITKADFVDLQNDSPQKYTIIVYSTKANSNLVLAWGCDDENGTVSFGQGTTVTIELLDRPPKYAGTYKVTSIFDLVSALPPPIDTIVDSLLELFKSPVGGALDLMCSFIGDVSVIEDVCGFIFDDPTNPSTDELTSTGGIVVNILDALIKSLAKGSIFGDVLAVGGDISDMLTAFTVSGLITILQEPDADGVWVKGQLREEWSSVTVKWSLGQNCDPFTDTNCGKQEFGFGAIQSGSPVSAELTGFVDDFFDLTIDLHPLNVAYGSLLDYILQNVLLPLLAGDGSDGGPVINSYELLLKSLVGGKDCLKPGFPKTCCEAFSDSVIGGGANIGKTLIVSACDAFIQLGATTISDQLNNLGTDTGGAFQIGTMMPCKMIDPDQNLVIDGFGSPGQPCLWDVRLKVFGASTTIESMFWGARL
ncbi:MAG: hypothetical protein H6744_00635 [Deltaproteobacteria bacterium]|nr:hypothetical protein [Deltaproteobacteria bacterium]MCB9785171.1 hypothetical protein [Deltaproteobacteria bacterium]